MERTSKRLLQRTCCCNSVALILHNELSSENLGKTERQKII